MGIKKGFQFLTNLDHLFSRLTRLFSQKLPKLLSDRGLFCIWVNLYIFLLEFLVRKALTFHYIWTLIWLSFHRVWFWPVLTTKEKRKVVYLPCVRGTLGPLSRLYIEDDFRQIMT